MRRVVACAALVLLSVIPVSVNAQVAPSSAAADSALEVRVREAASQLRCPVCQGLSLQDSPSELSQEMKSLVREQLRAGKTPEEVKRYFIDRYGEWILLEPRAHGFNWVVYALPVVLLAGGGGALTMAMRRWTTSPAVGDSVSDDEEEETVSANDL